MDGTSKVIGSWLSFEDGNTNTSGTKQVIQDQSTQ